MSVHKGGQFAVVGPVWGRELSISLASRGHSTFARLRQRHRPCTLLGFYNSDTKLGETTAYEPKLGNFLEELRGRKVSDISALRAGRAPVF